MVFNAVCNSMSVRSRRPVRLSMLSWGTPHNILSKPQAAFPHIIVETTESRERGMNPVAMTVINPRKEFWPSRGSNQRPSVLKTATLPTELWSSARNLGMLLLWFYMGHVLTKAGLTMHPCDHYIK